MKNEKIWVTVFNLSDEEIKTTMKLEESIENISQRKIDGTEVKRFTVKNEILDIVFDPFEIKILEMG